MDDLSGKLNEIFSSPESMEKIKNLVSMLSSSGSGEEPPPNRSASDNSSGIPDFDPALIGKIKKAMDLMHKGDPRIDLLLALKENMSEPRRKKVDEAIHLMRLINLMPLLKEQGFLWGDDS